MEEFSLLFFRGRAGLAAILKAVGVGYDDEVIIQAFTCVAVPEGIMAVGGKPIYADLSKGSVNFDPVDVARKITDRTKAIVIQHTFGYAGPINEVRDLVKGTDIRIIEDCCHTFETSIDNRRVGTIGDAAFYSFEWGKPLPCGVGGAVLSSNAAIKNSVSDQMSHLENPSVLRRVRMEVQYLAFALLYRPSSYWFLKSIFQKLSNAGAAESNFSDIDFSTPSRDFNLRICPSVGRRIRRGSRKVQSISAHSRQVVSAYRSMQLRAGVSRVSDDGPSGSVLARYPLWVCNKTELLEQAKQHRVEVADWYKTPVHPLSADQLPLANYIPGSCPVAESACKTIVSLPTNRHVSQREIDKIRYLFSA
jgi:dTDP-4-amino-4,6-dideoxygalactose transaminase